MTRRRRTDQSSPQGGATSPALDPSGLRAYLHRLPTPAFLLRRVEGDFELLEVNHAGRALGGELVAQAVGRRVSALSAVHPAIAEDAMRCWREQASVRRALNVRLGGELRTLNLTQVPVPPDWVLVHMEDVSAAEVAHTALARSEQKYRSLVENSLQAITISQGGRILFTNRAAAELTGRTVAEVLALRPEEYPELVHPDDREAVFRRFADRALGRLVPLRNQYRVVAKDGRVRWVESLVSTIEYEGAPAIMSVALDITEQKRAETERRDSEERYRAIVEAEPQCVMVLAPDGSLMDMNPAGLRMIEADSLAQVRGKDVLQLVAPSHREAFRELHRRAMAGGSGTLEFEIIGLKGGRRWLETHAVPLRGADGQVTGLLGITGDITERRRADDELRRSETRYRSLVRGALYGIYRSTIDGQLLEANPALVAMLGYQSEEELLSVDWSRQVYQDPEERVRLVQEYRDANQIDGAEAHWKKKDGTPVNVRLSGRVMRNPAGSPVGYEMMVEDVSAQRELEEEFRQAQKMEAVGQLAGGVAHDFNNLLTAILGSADLLLMDLPQEDPRREDLMAIRDAGERAATLTRQLLAFSRRQVLQPRVIGLNQVVGGMGKLLPRIIGEDIRLDLALAPDLASVSADPGQIEQVILNLAVNARDAMPDGGRLTIATANADLDAAFTARNPTVQPGAYVRLSVIDTGQGMDEGTLARVFEPFFTTKGPGKGTGLGLATVYGIVKQSGGYIFVRSRPHEGATFDVYLPAMPRSAADRGGAPAPARSGQGSETILLAEDDAAVRSLARRALEQYGYRVLEAANGQEALDLMRRHQAEIALLLTDIVMPEMGGRRSAEHMLQTWPGLKVLYMSGYAGPDQPDGRAMMQKPFTPESLARKVREVLDGA
jgi:PAS domain S-box-containing protein